MSLYINGYLQFTEGMQALYAPSQPDAESGDELRTMCAFVLGGFMPSALSSEAVYHLKNGNKIGFSFGGATASFSTCNIKLYDSSDTLKYTFTCTVDLRSGWNNAGWIALHLDPLTGKIGYSDISRYSVIPGFEWVVQPGLMFISSGHVPENELWGAITYFPDEVQALFEGCIKSPQVDPYQKFDEESGPGGGDPDRDPDSDPIPIPDLPTISAVDTGFITLFNPTAAELRTLANYMWSSGFDLDTLKKLFADPMDAILGLSIVPVDVPAGSSRAVSVGNISTGVSMTLAAQQYVKVECGTLHPSEWWGAYLDYSPYTKCEIYLPYIGTHPLNIDDIMDKDVTVEYHVDILSGACFAFVQCGDAVLYSFVGQCAASIPISGNDWTNVINGVMQIGAAVGSMVATGGATAPLAIPAMASTVGSGNLKPNVEKSGSVSGSGGMLGVQYPYLILTRPKLCIPGEQNEFMGYPSFITSPLSGLSGYTEIESIHLEGIAATQEELDEIYTLLDKGVIL